jgi:hypothetical protein
MFVLKGLHTKWNTEQATKKIILNIRTMRSRKEQKRNT